MLRRALLAVVLATAGVAVAPSANAAPAPAAGGYVSQARQDVFFHRLVVTGKAYLPSSTTAPVTVRVYADGKFVGRTVTNLKSPQFNAREHINGQHSFRFAHAWASRAKSVVVLAKGSDGQLHRLGSVAASHFRPTAGARIVGVAKKYVGFPYIEGGATPRGFDCSGFTMYVYQHAHVAALPHNADAQRRMSHMRRVSRSAARPGDLVFYMSGGSAYHVAIYAGHGMQYAAATVRDGVRYQPIWSSAVVFGALT